MRKARTPFVRPGTPALPGVIVISFFLGGMVSLSETYETGGTSETGQTGRPGRSSIAHVERRHSNSLYLSLEEWPRLPFTARIERPPLYCGGSASKKGTWPLLPHPSEAARCASTGDQQAPSHSLFLEQGSSRAVVHLLADQFLGFQPVFYVALRLSPPLLIEVVGFLRDPFPHLT